MLILAGVSINAIVGDNGVLTKTTYASFLSEMSAVEEAVQMWKAGEIIEAQGDEVKAIPANGLCNANDLTNTERLVGEVGFYRVWSLTSTMPTTDILSSANNFNSSFESELVFYPAGVQDLYYLNNDTLEIKGNKTYLIDATTGMIFSMTGISLKGVRCYSSNMAKAVMNGTIEQPLFAEAEVSGTGSGEKLAGNVQSEYLMDENGNYILDESGNKIKNPDYNPNGFQIIADRSNDNVYKLYNNGDLYGKGVKGYLLNSSPEVMSQIDSTEWKVFDIPSEIPGVDNNNITVINGQNTVYVVDENGYLWAWGSNDSNKLGLTKEEQIEYTGKVATKLNVNGKKVYKVFPCARCTFVVTQPESDNQYELYASGYNSHGELGIGNNVTTTDSFIKVNISNPEKIISIAPPEYTYRHWTVLLKEEGETNKVYFTGSTYTGEGDVNSFFKNTDLKNSYVTEFTEIFNGIYGNVFTNKIEYIQSYHDHNLSILFVDNTKNLTRWYYGNIYDISFSQELQDNIEKISIASERGILLRRNSNNEREVWAFTRQANESVYWGYGTIGSEFVNITSNLKEILDVNEIKDIYQAQSATFVLMNDGRIFGVGANTQLGIGQASGSTLGLQCITDISNLTKNIDSFYNESNYGNCLYNGLPILKTSDNNLILTGNSSILFGETVFQKSWIKIANNVKKFKAQTSGSRLAYIDFNDDIWVLGPDSTLLGLNTENAMNIPNFVLLKEYVKNTEIYENISGTVEDYGFDVGAFYLKTNASDNNSLYCSGKYDSGSWTTQYSGLGENISSASLVKLLDNVRMVSYGDVAKFTITYDNKMYKWGNDNGYQLGGSSPKTPMEFSIDNLNANDITRIFPLSCYTALLTAEKSLFMTGLYREADIVNGLETTYKTFAIYDYSTYMNDEKLKEITGFNANSKIFLTENGNLYGIGKKNTLGMGTSSTDMLHFPTYLSGINKVSYVVAGNGFYIAIKEDGTVYGTGTNVNGILGRWIGIDRNTPNSRYKTAFEWVECPELEI